MKVSNIDNLINPISLNNKNHKKQIDTNFYNLVNVRTNDKQVDVTNKTHNDVDIKQVFESMTGTSATQTSPTYNVTQEQAEYLREKYGAGFYSDGNITGTITREHFLDYSTNQSREFFNELYEMGIISKEDCEYASGIIKKPAAYLVSIYCVDTGVYEFRHDYDKQQNAVLNLANPNFDKGNYTWAEYIKKLQDKVEWFDWFHSQDSRSPESASYQFGEKYNCNFSKFDIENGIGVDPDWVQSLEKTANVINQIFG